MSLSLWQQCLARLQDELPATEFSMWIRPLQAELSDNTLALYAPNRFVLDWVRDKYLNNINGLLTSFCGADAPQLRFEVGTKPVTQTPQAAVTSNVAALHRWRKRSRNVLRLLRAQVGITSRPGRTDLSF